MVIAARLFIVLVKISRGCGGWPPLLARPQSAPRNGCTYCSAMSQGKKIQVSWLTSVT